MLAFVFSEEAVVDEDAGELVADGFVEKCGEDGGIDAAREAADDGCVADLFADGVDGGVDEAAHFPGAAGFADAVEEILDDLGAVGRVGDFGVELHAEKGVVTVSAWRRGGRWGCRREGGRRGRGFGPGLRGTSRRWCRRGWSGVGHRGWEEGVRWSWVRPYSRAGAGLTSPPRIWAAIRIRRSRCRGWERRGRISSDRTWARLFRRRRRVRRRG